MRDRYRWLRRIEQLNPVGDHHEIYRISAGIEFPWDYHRALDLALFRTYCVPSMSGLWTRPASSGNARRSATTTRCCSWRSQPSTAMTHLQFYRQVGLRMGIRDIPIGYREFRQFKEEYEASRFRFAESNRRVGRYTLDLLCRWYPRPLRPAVDLAVRAMLDAPVLAVFDLTPAPRWAAGALRAGLRGPSAVRARPSCYHVGAHG